MPLASEIASVLQEELERAAVTAGRRLLTYYINDLVAAQLVSATSSQDALRAAVAQALSSLEPQTSGGALEKLLQNRSYPTTRTRDVIQHVESLVRAAPVLEGVPLESAAESVAEHCSHRISPLALRLLLKRNLDHHAMTIKHNRVQLRPDLVMEVLNRRQQAKKSTVQLLSRRGKKSAKTVPAPGIAEAH